MTSDVIHTLYEISLCSSAYAFYILTAISHCNCDISGYKLPKFTVLLMAVDGFLAPCIEAKKWCG